MSDPTNAAGFVLDNSQLSKWRSAFFELPLNRLAQNICTAGDPICASQYADLQRLSVGGKERHEVVKLTKETAGGPSWICMGLDLLRHAMRKDCELSASYLFYWHKLERCNYFLYAVTECLQRCEPLEGRTFQYLMKHAVPDGGNWQMLVNLVQKYGVMPKQSYLASWSATRTLHLNRLLKSKLHEDSSVLHAQFTFDGDAKKLPLMAAVMIEELHKIISICLGIPPSEFTFKFKDEESSQNFTPLYFYESMIKPYFDLGSQVCLGHDPRLSSKYLCNYCIAHSSNMLDGLQQSYTNIPMELLIQIITDSLARGAPVWLTCDVNLLFKNKSQVFNLNTHNFNQVFGFSVGTELNKAERMLYKATRPNTVLLLTGVTLDAQKQPVQFSTMRKTVEPKSDKATKSSDSLVDPLSGVAWANCDASAEEDGVKRKVSNGKATVLHVDWLREYAFKVVVDASFVPPSVMHALQTQPSEELPIWDPMGALLT